MSVPMDFVAVPQVTTTGIHACLQFGDPESDVAIINLRRMEWIEPAGLVSLAIFIEDQAGIGRLPRLFGPIDGSRGRYLRRMHLDQVVEGAGGVHDLPTSNEWDREGSLLALQRFDGKQAPPELASIVEEQLGGTASALAIHKGICEVGANVPDHSGREHGYIAAITTHQGSRVQFAVGDAGRGVLEPLSARGYDTPTEVMAALFRGGVSRLDEHGRGRGLARTRELVATQGGHLYMASGLGGLVAAASGEFYESRYVHAIAGTMLQATVPC